MNNVNESKADLPLRAIAWTVCGVLTVAYVASWVVRLAGGPAMMETSDVIPWSGMMAFFFFLATAGAGLLVVGGAASFSLLPAVAKYQRWFYVGAVACFVSAGLVVLIDLGRPERVLNMLLFMRIASPFAWDFIFLALSVVLGAVCVLRKPGRVLSGVTAFAGLAVVAVEGLIFVVSPGRELWQSASVPLLFLLEALVAGMAVAALVAPRDKGVVRGLLGLAAALLVFTVAEWMYAYLPGTGDAQALALLMGGPLAPLYWVQVVVCTLVPLVLLVAVPRGMSVRVASVLLLCGIVLAKLTIMLAGQSLDVTGVFHAYVPTLLEAGISLGSLGFAGLVALLGAKFVPQAYAQGVSVVEEAGCEGVLEATAGEA